MPRDAFPEPDEPGIHRTALFNRVLFDYGWTRFLPDSTIRILSAVMILGSPTGTEIGALLPPAYGEERPRGLDGPAWEPPVAWTDETLRAVHEEHPPRPGDARTAAEANAEDQRDHDARIAEIDAYAAALGVPAPRTVADVVALLVACGVLTARTDTGETRYELNPHVGLPGEVLPLSAQRRQDEDALRWRMLYEPVTQQIIALFHPGSEQPLQTLRTTLQRLARELDADVETARAALAALVRDPDFSANRDPELIAEHAVIEITVDWDVFATNRMHLVAAPPEDD